MLRRRPSPVIVWLLGSAGAALLSGACGDTEGQNLPQCNSHQFSSLATQGSGGSGGGDLLGICLSRSPSLDPTGQLACVALEMRTTDTCDCNAEGRIPVAPAHQPLVQEAIESALGQASGWNCFCEVAQLADQAQLACQNDVSAVPLDTNGNSIHGFCYVDATVSPPTGNPVLTEPCASTEQRLVRFVGATLPAPGATLQVVCVDEQCD